MDELPVVHYWQDPVKRSGPDNMAIDSWLLATAEEPVLRVYEWKGDWGSVGYFGALSVARATLPGVSLVRRATGGGLVDHREDHTYTLVIPRRFALARYKGAESYRVIHSALREALEDARAVTALVEKEQPEDSPVCFEKPVAWDLVDACGAKVAGAGQRRTRRGLLHQGSVMMSASLEGCDLFAGLAARLTKDVKEKRREPPEGGLAALKEQFSSREWLERR